MVGNYGVPNPATLDEMGLPKGFESYKIHAAGLVVQDYSHHYSHWNAHFSLADWLKKEGIPAIGGIDTRMLTKKIRSRGAMLGRIEFEDGEVRRVACVALVRACVHARSLALWPGPPQLKKTRPACPP